MPTFTRRSFVAQLSTITLASPFASYATSLNNNPEYVLADRNAGKVRGIRERGVTIFKGIPYAGQASGDYRFRQAAPVKKWSGVRDALDLGAPAMHVTNLLLLKIVFS